MPGFGSYGVVGAGSSSSGGMALLVEELRVRGFAILPQVLAEEEVTQLNAAMDEVYALQSQEVGGEAALQMMNDTDIVRCLLAYSPAFMRLALNETMIAVAKAMLGENIVLIMQNGIINRPDRVQFQTKWHRDLNYQHWVSSKPLAMSALVCLEDFNEETGGTVFLPASHKSEDFLSSALVERLETTPSAPKGSIIVFDCMTFHRAGVNRSKNIRRAVNHVFGVPILAQQVDIPAMLDQEPPSDPWLSGFLGYRWNPVQDVAAWRKRKIDQSAKATAARV